MNSFAGVSREKGKFRTFLLAALNHFLSDEWDRAWAEKRGERPGHHLDRDENEAEERFLQGGMHRVQNLGRLSTGTGG